ncbi:hypothetical protein E2C01_101623 [Portunus trituberculatus]|uniref:Uncharacterized protein n=1 Tax=Portunus trituberculatus TaxID=210409 RepID=A0A5B7KGC0_PORTR|nr:hypothetical protein [Portunus trituberculatus]
METRLPPSAGAVRRATSPPAPSQKRWFWARQMYVNPFSTGTHFYLEICVRLGHFIDIRNGLWRSED